MTQAEKKSSSLSATNRYLLAYNASSAALWGYVFVKAVASLVLTNGDYTLTFVNASKDLVWIQSLAVLEILHAALGLVRSPLMTTVMQVFSRLLLAVGILYYFPVKEATQHWALTTMTFAWSITEIIRYSFYAFSIASTVPEFIVWCRYTLFYLLYPVGASSEVIVAYQALPAIKQTSPALYYPLIAILLFYPIGFFQLFTYMIKQRAKTFGSKKKRS